MQQIGNLRYAKHLPPRGASSHVALYRHIGLTISPCSLLCAFSLHRRGVLGRGWLREGLQAQDGLLPHHPEAPVNGRAHRIRARLAKAAANFLSQPPVARVPGIEDVPVRMPINRTDGFERK